jgi:PAS domain-containing protein
MTKPLAPLTDIEELRQRRAVFDIIWLLAIVAASACAFGSWRLGLVQFDIAPIIWSLGALALVQLASSARTAACSSAAQLRRLALVSQLFGMAAMGVAWHLFGGLQQPLFPVLIMLPMVAGALILTFWQQQLTIVVFLGLLLSGILLSPGANHFIEERYSLTLLSPSALPAWIPRSRVAFADMSTSPAYDLMTAGTMAVLAVAFSASSRAIVALFVRFMDRTHTLQEEVSRAQILASQLIATAASAEVLLAPGTGRIVHASESFLRAFDISGPAAGQFLLDAVDFAYPNVIKRLLACGGDEIQGATVRGREVVLRLRAGVIDLGDSRLVRLCMESCDEVGWRAALDTFDHPLFAIDSQGNTLLLNRSAVDVFGPDAEGSKAATLFDTGASSGRWWDIAPLESARRMLDRGGHRYIVSIRRERIAEGVGEWSFVHLHERERANAAAAS